MQSGTNAVFHRMFSESNINELICDYLVRNLTLCQRTDSPRCRSREGNSNLQALSHPQMQILPPYPPHSFSPTFLK